MIPTTNLPGTDLETPRIGFGTSRLHHVRSSRERQAILARAYEVGIRHFDTAPAYGHGLSERELGAFLRRHRSDCTVATKYGIPIASWIDKTIEMGRNLALPSLAIRALGRRAGLVRDRRPPLTAKGLEQSVHASLRRLGVEHIDLHLLHEPSIARCQDFGALIGTYRDLTAKGLIGAFGVAGAYEDCKALLEATGTPGLVLQTAEHEWNPALVPDITYGVVATGPQCYASTAGVDHAEAVRRIATALTRRPHGIVLVSTTRSERLQSVASVFTGAGAVV